MPSSVRRIDAGNPLILDVDGAQYGV